MNQLILDPAIKSRIMTKLDDVEKTENITILFAIESGSRAWGFPSPDSDYDVRFVYAHPTDWYLSIFPGRDVTELPLDAIYDINGWDIKKALQLLLKPNPVLLEWLSSPVRYRWNEDICNKIDAFASRIAHNKSCMHHYLNMGARQWRAYIDGKDNVILKKYLYVVRPAMALRWIRLNPDLRPPMNFLELMKGCDLPDPLNKILLEIIDKKAQTRELGETKPIADIDAFITSEFQIAEATAPRIEEEKNLLTNEADALFQSILNDITTTKG